jgi:hypothetical protein
MQAIEFESIVRDKAIPLPKFDLLRPGQPVRVVVMFDAMPDAEAAARQTAADLAKLEANTPAVIKDRLATLKPHPEALGDSLSSPWDENAWEKKWESA